MALLRVCPTTPLPLPFVASKLSVRANPRFSNFTVRSCNIPLELQPNESRKLVMAVKEKLEKEHPSLPVGSNGRDDEDMILWFLKDRMFSVEEAVSKLAKAIVSSSELKDYEILHTRYNVKLACGKVENK